MQQSSPSTAVHRALYKRALGYGGTCCCASSAEPQNGFDVTTALPVFPWFCIWPCSASCMPRHALLPSGCDTNVHKFVHPALPRPDLWCVDADRSRRRGEDRTQRGTTTGTARRKHATCEFGLRSIGRVTVLHVRDRDFSKVSLSHALRER